jgi:hypothetical protein
VRKFPSFLIKYLMKLVFSSSRAAFFNRCPG